jgi:hypothetical protein
LLLVEQSGGRARKNLRQINSDRTACFSCFRFALNDELLCATADGGLCHGLCQRLQEGFRPRTTRMARGVSEWTESGDTDSERVCGAGPGDSTAAGLADSFSAPSGLVWIARSQKPWLPVNFCDVLSCRRRTRDAGIEYPKWACTPAGYADLRGDPDAEGRCGGPRGLRWAMLRSRR